MSNVLHRTDAGPFWPGTDTKRSHGNAFDWQGRASGLLNYHEIAGQKHKAQRMEPRHDAPSVMTQAESDRTRSIGMSR